MTTTLFRLIANGLNVINQQKDSNSSIDMKKANTLNNGNNRPVGLYIEYLNRKDVRYQMEHNDRIKALKQNTRNDYKSSEFRNPSIKEFLNVGLNSFRDMRL